MKIQFRNTVIISALIVSFAWPVFTLAAEQPTIKPGSFFYGFVTTFEKINLFFTFNQEKKAEKAMKYAEKRLAEAEAVAGDKNSDAVKTAISGYEASIALAAAASKKVKDETKAENLLNLIADNASKHQQILSDVLTKVPDEAKEAITRAIEASRKGQEEALKQVVELKGEVEKLKQEIAELKKQQDATTPKNAGAQSQSTSIKELKKEIEELKKQSATPEATTQAVIQAPTQKTEVKEELQTVTLTNSLGISYTFSDPIINKQRIRDLIGVGFVVTKGTLPDGIIIQSTIETSTSTPTTQTQISTTLQILSVNITPSLYSAQIEWQTNIPSNSKIFISGDNLSTKVFNSESGLSTRHIVHATGFTSNTTYSYEIETIASDQIVKREGSFSTKTGNLSVQADKTSVQLTAWNDVNISATYTENGKPVPIEVLVTTPEWSKTYKVIKDWPQCGGGLFLTQESGTTGGSCTVDGKLQFAYRPKTLGIHTISATANGVTKSVDIQATSYVKVDPVFKPQTIYQQDTNNSSYPVEVPEYPIGYQNATIVNFNLTAADEPFRIESIKFESDIDPNKLRLPVSGSNAILNYSSTLYQIQIRDTTGVLVGAHTFTVKEITVVGIASGDHRFVSGLPAVFAFKIK